MLEKLKIVVIFGAALRGRRCRPTAQGGKYSYFEELMNEKSHFFMKIVKSAKHSQTKIGFGWNLVSPFRNLIANHVVILPGAETLKNDGKQKKNIKQTYVWIDLWIYVCIYLSRKH